MTKRPLLYTLLALFLFATGLSGQRVITTVAGTDFVFPPDAIPGLTAPLGRISSVAADTAGNIYIVDENNNLVQKYDASGNITVFAGNGQPAFSGDGGYAKNASLNAPRGVATDTSGNVYIADTGNHRVRKVTPDGVINTIGGNGASFYSGDRVPAVQTGIPVPLEVATDKHGNVFVTDTSPRVRKIGPDGIITTVAGNGVAGFSGDGGPATSAAFNGPIALAVDANDNLYISDWLNNRIRRVTPDGIVRTFAGTGEDAQARLINGPGLQATFSRPRQLAVAPDGSILVADQGVSLIRKITPAGIVSTIAGGFAVLGDGGPAVAASFDSPSAVTVDRTGNIYVGDTERTLLRKITTDGIIHTVAGNGALRASPNGGLATGAVLNSPQALGLDKNGHLFFSNTNDHRVLELLDSSLYITAGNGLRGGGDGKPAFLAGLNFPAGVGFDSVNNLYIADQYDQLVRKVNTSGIISTVAGPADFGGQGAFPTGLTVDSSDNVFIVDRQTSRVRKLAPNGTVTFVAGAGGAGYRGDGGPATTALLGFPRGASTDRAGNLYIADTANNVIRKVAALPAGVPAGTPGVISTVAGNTKAAYTGDGGPATAASLNNPGGVWLDPNGIMYIADTGNNVIRKVTPDGIISTFAGTGLGAFFGDGGDPTAAALYQPNGIVGDGADTFYIADTANNRIRAITGNNPPFAVDRPTLTFSGIAGSASPGAQAVNLACDVQGISYSISSDSPWLSAGPASGTMPANLQVTVDPSSLAAGAYQGIVTVTAPLANPKTQTISVTLTLAAPNPPKLAAQPDAVTLSTSEETQPKQQTIYVSNVGSGTLTFDAAPNSDRGWLKTAVVNNTAIPNAPGSLILTADPAGLEAGSYNGSVRVNSSTTGETAAVPVTLTVTPSARPKLVLSQTGLTFRGTAGTCSPNDPQCRMDFPQCFAVLNGGQGTLDFTVTSDQPWLRVGKVACPYPSISGLSSVTEVVVQPVVALPQGDYEAHVQVSAPGADNSPQTVTVKFKVVAPGTPAGPIVRPTGLIFIGSGTQTPGSLDAYINNLARQTFKYSATPAFDAGANNWFSVAPGSGSFSGSTDSANVRVYPKFTGLAAGVYSGRVTVQTDLGPQTIEVVAQVNGPPAAGAAGLQKRDACGATQLSAIFTWVAPDFNAQTGNPLPVEVYIVDNCGNPMTTGTAVASFNNGDPAINLLSLRNGRWTGTWTPANVPDSNRVEIRVRFTSADGLSGEIARTGNLTQ